MPRSQTTPRGAKASAAVPDRRAQIIRVAGRLLADHGFDRTSMRMIARAVEVQPASLYHHFKDKRALLFAIIEEFMVAFNARILPVLTGPGSPELRLATAISLHVTISDEFRGELVMGIAYKRTLDEHQGRRVAGLRRAYQDAVLRVIEEGCAKGVFRVDDPQLTVLALLDMANGVRVWFSPDNRLSIDVIAQYYAQSALALCRAGSAASSAALPDHQRRKRRN